MTYNNCKSVEKDPLDLLMELFSPQVEKATNPINPSESVNKIGQAIKDAKQPPKPDSFGGQPKDLFGGVKKAEGEQDPLDLLIQFFSEPEKSYDSVPMQDPGM